MITQSVTLPEESPAMEGACKEVKNPRFAPLEPQDKPKHVQTDQMHGEFIRYIKPKL